MVLFLSDCDPTDVFDAPVVLFLKAQKPIAVLFDTLLLYKAAKPTATLEPPVVLHLKALPPTATF